MPRHSCIPSQHLLLPKQVGHQDLPGTQPPTWLLPWLIRHPCILGLTQWVHLQALQHGGLTPSIWVASSFPHHLCTNILSTTLLPHLSPHRLPIRLPALATCLLHRILITLKSTLLLVCPQVAPHTRQPWLTPTRNTFTPHPLRLPIHTTVIRLRIINRTSMVKPEEVCSLRCAVIVISHNKTHSAKG